jgi:hypothetical protein
MHVTSTMLVSCILVITQASRADQASDDTACWNTYLQQYNICTAAQVAADNGFYTTYQGIIFQDSITAATTVQNDYITETNAAGACWTALWKSTGNPNIQGDTGSCGNAYTLADIAALATYASAVAKCNDTSANPAACACSFTATYSFTQAKDKATYNQCSSDAQNQCNNNCVPSAQAVQQQADSVAGATQNLADANAQANYSKSTTQQDGYTTPLCEYTANLTYDNCVNSVDNQENCCFENAASAYNTAMQAAFTGLCNTLGPADAQYQHDYPLCSAQQSHDDAIAGATCTFTEANDLIVENTADGTANDLLTYTEALDKAQCTEDTANCVCTYPNDQSQQTTCTQAAQAKQNNSDLAAKAANILVTGVPPQNPGSAYTTWYNNNQAAEALKSGTLAQDQNKCSGCQSAAIGTFNIAYDNATTTYNAQCGTAWNNYQAQLQNCNGGG